MNFKGQDNREDILLNLQENQKKMQEKDINEDTKGPMIEEVDQDENKEAKSEEAAQMPALPKELLSKENLQQLSKMFGGVDPKSAKFRDELERLQRMIKKHQFWDTQPVPKMADEEVKESGPIDDKTTVADIKKAPYSLPDGFQWSDVDLKDDKDAKDNYVEDDDGDFRFDYSIEFLRWTLLVPTYKPKWHIGVRVTKSQKLVGFISGIPLTLMVDGQQIKSAEINFLCVLNKLRTKRLAPVLIKQVTRRINLKGIFQAVYTAGVHLPRPISQTKYYHRSLNPPKLVDVRSLLINARIGRIFKSSNEYKGLSTCEEVQTTKGAKKQGATAYDKKRCPKSTQSDYVILRVRKYKYSPGFIKMYIRQKKFRVYTKFTLEQISHLFVPRQNVIQTFVIDDPNDPKKITDILSFYHLPSSILKSQKHKTLYVAYSFYNVATSAELASLIKDALILCKQRNFDVYNALNIMENATVFDELKFGQGNGNLQYYLYNYKIPTAQPSDLGIVLV